MNEEDRAAIARGIVDQSFYMVLGTADASGRPWAAPVYFAPSGYREFFWVSSPEATHSRNIAVRPEVGIVIFDSRASIGTGQGVYMRARAEPVEDADLERGIEIFSRRSQEHGGKPWSVEDVQDEIRLYRATASEYSMLAKDGRPDHRIPVELGP
jgi:hypothetical protein